MDNTASIWLTRPEEDSRQFAAELAEHGITTRIAPVMHLTLRPMIELPSMPDALLFTSRHSTHVLGTLPQSWRALPVFCVGSATASYAREYGATHIIPGPSDILALLPRLMAQLPNGSLLHHFSGEETRIEIAPLLAAQEIRVARSIVYTAHPHHTLSDTIVADLSSGGIHGVVFFSPRSASITNTLLQNAGLTEITKGVHAYCLSMAVASAASALPWAGLHSCHLPTRIAMRDLILSHCAKKR
jgi:uroporphyrinogen-III synthase